MPTAVAPGGTSEHLGAAAHDHAAPQRGMALGAFGERGAAERDALVDRASVTHLGRLADHHAHAVVDEHVVPDRGPRMDLDAGGKARQMRDEPARDVPAARPAGMGDAVQQQRVQARITGEHLPRRTRSGVAFADAGDVFTQSGKHVVGLLLAKSQCMPGPVIVQACGDASRSRCSQMGEQQPAVGHELSFAITPPVTA
jgi:hypothetical protein